MKSVSSLNSQQEVLIPSWKLYCCSENLWTLGTLSSSLGSTCEIYSSSSSSSRAGDSEQSQGCTARKEEKEEDEEKQKGGTRRRRKKKSRRGYSGQDTLFSFCRNCLMWSNTYTHESSELRDESVLRQTNSTGGRRLRPQLT